LNKVVDAIDDVQKKSKKYQTDKEKMYEKVRDLEKDIQTEVVDARMKVYDAKQSKDEDKIKEANKKELEVWNKRNEFYNLLVLSENLLYKDLSDAEQSSVNKILEKYPDTKPLYDLFVNFNKKYEDLAEL
jgi:cell division septum initiation protein DivIVA